MSMPIDLDEFSEQELIELNRRIVERLQSMRRRRRFEEMARFNVGDVVSFTPEVGRVVVGRVARANTKTITVIAENGERWRVSPAFLSAATEGVLLSRDQETAGSQGNIISLRGPGASGSGR